MSFQIFIILFLSFSINAFSTEVKVIDLPARSYMDITKKKIEDFDFYYKHSKNQAKIKKDNEILFQALSYISQNNKRLGSEKTEFPPQAVWLKIPKVGAVKINSNDSLRDVSNRFNISKSRIKRKNRKLFKHLSELLEEKITSELFNINNVLLTVKDIKVHQDIKGWYKTEDSDSINLFADLFLVIDSSRKLSQMVDEDVLILERNLKSDYQEDGYFTHEGKKVYFNFTLRPLRIDATWKKSDLTNLVYFHSRKVSEETSFGSKRITFPAYVRYLGSNSNLQGVTRGADIAVFQSSRDPRTFTHEIAHRFMQFFAVKHPSLVNRSNDFDHGTGGILSNPTRSLSQENVEYFIRGLPYDGR